MTKQTVQDAARELKISEARVRQLASELQIGERIGSRLIVFSPKEVEKMRSRKTQRGPKASKK